MPQAVIPFTMTTKSFLITIFAVMVMMRLMLAVIGALLVRRKTDPSLEAEPMDGTDLAPSGFKFWRSVVKWKRKPDVDLEVVMSGV